ncbi:MAG: AAA family ATPase [Candidatus Pacebacteria bacterium]|nr:AAA family ATPase [Candidatus Paceibacterota bacterium]
MKINKKEILQKSKTHISFVQKNIKKSLLNREKRYEKNIKKLSISSPSESATLQQIIRFDSSRKVELKKLYPNPYFIRCDVIFEDEKQEKTIYFAKFNFDKKSIYSWTTPAAQLRFENIGKFSFTLQNNKKRFGKLLRKDNFMIVDGKILFLTSETKDYPKELIYQEYFSTKKKKFLLPEIVSQMEKAQDKVIRAKHNGPFLITGAAGSGKTTLALHRIAYLKQSPETNLLYPSKSIIVFVQDTKTKEYFSHLLPELGIDKVEITTFSEWAINILKIKNLEFSITYGDSKEERRQFKYEKNQTLLGLENNNLKKFKYDSKKPHLVLEEIYKKSLSKQSFKLFLQQKKQKTLDRFDLTLLLKIHHNKIKDLLTYSLILIDEFQNYLPDQIKIIQNYINKDNRSIIYVGDIAQKIYFGTIYSLEQIQEIIPNERKVVLNKVYRSTKQILKYIKKMGYEIEISKKTREGVPVVEKSFQNKKQEIGYIKKYLLGKKYANIGILSRDKDYLEEFQKKFNKQKNIHLFSIRQAQGVEFDIVFIVGFNKKEFLENIRLNNIEEEWIKIEKDILYVGLTRAINELHVLEKL